MPLIVQVVQEFSLKGGVESVAFELQTAWQRMSLPAYVVTGTTQDSNRSDVDVIKAPFGQYATRGRFAKYFGRMIVVPAFTLKVSRYLKQNYSDAIILSHGDTFYGDALIVHAVNKASLMVKQANGSYSWMLNPMHWWVSVRDHIMIGGLRYKKYIAISNRVADELMQLYKVPKSRIVVIPNGVNIDRFNPVGPGRSSVRAALGIPKNAPVLLFVGHEFHRKGLAFIISALAKIPQDYYLVVVGNDQAAPFKTLAAHCGAADRVIFTGPRQDLPEIYRACDVFVFPTAYEAFGLVAMEALASGLPLIATKVGGIEDYLVDGYNGYFIERDADSISTAIVLAMGAKYDGMSNAARRTALDYSWDHIAKHYYDILVQLK